MNPAIDLAALERANSLRMFLVALAALAVAALGIVYAWYAQHTYAREARLAYVKLNPNGQWEVDADLADGVTYFDATLRTVLFDWVQRRYSKRPASILDDWSIANAMYSPAMQQWFNNDFKASVQAAKIAANTGSEQIMVRPRTLQHIDAPPEHPGSKDSEPVRTLVYATEQTIPGNAAKPSKETRQVYRITWRFLSKAAIQSRPDLLRWDPIGVEILDVEVTDDTSL